jgi:hypothetical protein
MDPHAASRARHRPHGRWPLARRGALDGGPGLHHDAPGVGRAQVARGQHEQVQCRGADGGDLVGPVPDALVARDGQPTRRADLVDPLGIGRVHVEVIAVRLEGNGGVAQRLAERPAPGVAVDEQAVHRRVRPAGTTVAAQAARRRSKRSASSITDAGTA